MDLGVPASFFQIFQILFPFLFHDGRLVFRGHLPDLVVGLEENYGVRVEAVAVGEHVDEGGRLEEDVEEGVDREED